MRERLSRGLAWINPSFEGIEINQNFATDATDALIEAVLMFIEDQPPNRRFFDGFGVDFGHPFDGYPTSGRGNGAIAGLFATDLDGL